MKRVVRRWLWVGVVAGAACGEPFPESGSSQESSYASRADAVHVEDNGTQLSAQLDGANRCTPDAASGTAAMSGVITTTGSVDSVEISAVVDGAAPLQLAELRPQDFVHGGGREKMASFTASMRLTSGAHQISVCFTQSGAEGRRSKQVCTPSLHVQMDCEAAGGELNERVPPAPERDLTPPTTLLQATPLANGEGWNRDEVTLRFSASDEGGSGVGQIHVQLTGAQAGAYVDAGASSSHRVSAEGVTQVTYFAVDGAGNAETPKTFLVRLDRTAPVIRFGGLTPSANEHGWNNEDVRISFTVDDALSGLLTSTPGPLLFSAEGAQQRQQVTATDLAGNVATLESPVVNLDRTAPSISGLPADGCTLWAPNHKLVLVAELVGEDALAGIRDDALTISGRSNEEVDGKGDGNTAPDIVISGGRVELRAERSGRGSGRIYTVDASIQDLAGNASSASFQCLVPHDQRAPSSSAGKQK